MTQKAVTNIYC